MTYVEAIAWLKENNIRKDDGTFYEVGEDIPEAPERLMTDKIGVPIMLNRYFHAFYELVVEYSWPNFIRFPTHIKAFYMQRCKDDPNFTESVDVLMPNVGEIVGGSMRMDKLEDLLEG